MIGLYFGYGASDARELYAGSSKATNCLKEQRGKREVALYRRPGTERKRSTSAFYTRGILSLDEVIYQICDDTFYRLDADFDPTVIGTINTSDGRVYMRSNGFSIGLVDGQDFWDYNLTTLAFVKRTLPDGVNPSHISYSQGFFYINDVNTGDVYHHEDSYDTSTWNSLDQSSAEYAPDNLLALADVSGSHLMLGKNNVEVWTYTGNINFVIEPVQGLTYNFGIAAKDSFASMTDAGFFLARDGGGGLQAVMMVRGTQAKPIGEQDVIGIWSRYSTVADATGFALNLEGHPLYILSFPSEDETWVYDDSISDGSRWCRWESYNETFTKRGRFVGDQTFLFNDKQYCASSYDGGIYEIGMELKTDDGQPIIVEAESQEISKPSGYFRHNYVKVMVESGHGLADQSLQGHNPQIRLSYSDDHGHTWKHRDWKSIGKQGEFSAQVKFRGLGRSKHRRYKIQLSDPVKFVLVNPSYLSLDNEA